MPSTVVVARELEMLFCVWCCCYGIQCCRGVGGSLSNSFVFTQVFGKFLIDERFLELARCLGGGHGNGQAFWYFFCYL